MRKIIVILVLVPFLALVCYALGFGTLRLELDPSNTENLDITIVKQLGVKEQNVHGKTSKLLRRGTYQVTVSNGGRQYFAVVKIGGFFRTTSIKATLNAQKARSFVAQDPLPCVYTTSRLFLSSPCGASLDDVKQHVPSNKARPTYTKPLTNSLEGFLEGRVEEEGLSLVLVKTDSGHNLYRLNDDGSLSLYKRLADLDSSRFYSVTDGSKGFVAFNNFNGEIVIFNDIKNLSGNKQMVPATNKELPLYTASLQDDKLLLGYFDEPSLPSNFKFESALTVHSEEVDSPESNGVIEIRQNDKSFSVTTEFGHISALGFCGNDFVCALGDEGDLAIYSHDNGFNKHGVVRGIVDFSFEKESLLVGLSNYIVSFDPATMRGEVVYQTPDSYSICGIDHSAYGILVCIESSDGKQFVLALNLDQEDTNGIDRIIAGLRHNGAIESIVAQGKFVHYSPKLGEPTFQEDIQELGYGLQEINDAISKADSAIKESGLIALGYTVVNGLR